MKSLASAAFIALTVTAFSYLLIPGRPDGIYLPCGTEITKEQYKALYPNGCAGLSYKEYIDYYRYENAGVR